MGSENLIPFNNRTESEQREIAKKEADGVKLTLKQKRFADEYIISGNATEAAIKAGYSKKTANRIGAENLSKLVIKDYIDKHLKAIEDEKIADQKEILQYLTSVMRGEARSAVVVVEGCGDGVTEARLIDKPPDERDKLKAAEQLGKRYGLWTEKVDVNATVETSAKFDDIISQLGGDGLEE